MGYKTVDYAEKEKLESEGHKVIACKGRFKDSPEYEFDFDMTLMPTESVTTVSDNTANVVKEPIVIANTIEEPKKRGNPNWFKGRKK
jgi:hypothetical protein